MIRVALRGLAGRKFRAVLTAIAIVLGVAMISGTLVLTDTIDRAFNRIFVNSYAGTDAVVRSAKSDITFEGETAVAPAFSESVLGQVAIELERRGREREHLRGDRGQGRRQGRQGDLEERADLRVRHRPAPIRGSTRSS